MEAVLRPQSQEAWQPGLVLAIVAHGMLLLALAFGVQWQTQPPPVVEAEMWAEMPTAEPEVAAAPEPSRPATTQAPPDPVPPIPAEPTPEKLSEPILTPPPAPVPAPAPLPTPVLKSVPAKAPAKTKELFVPDPPEVRERLSQARDALNKASAPVAAPVKPAAPKPVMVPAKPIAEALPLPKPLPPTPVVPVPAPAPIPVPPAPPNVPAVTSKPVPVPVAASVAAPGKPLASAGSAANVPKLNEVLTRQEVEQARQSNLKRMMAKLAEDALYSAGPTPEYAARINARIKPNIRFTETPSGNPITKVKVICAPDGKIISRTILVPSGLASWDQAVLRAIDRTEILPRNEQGKVPSPMQLDFRPGDF